MKQFKTIKCLFLTCFLIVGTLIPRATSNAKTNKEEQILSRILDPANYNTASRAYGENPNAPTPTVVYVDIFIRSIDAIDDRNMEFSTQLTFRMSWIDTRLKYVGSGRDGEYVTLTNLQRIWTPDLFFANEKKGDIHTLLQPNAFARIKPNGEVLISQRISLTLSCEMDLKNFPMDNQTCFIRMASYAYTTSDLVFRWKPYDAVQLAPRIPAPKFKLDNFTLSSCQSVTSTGEYSCLKLDLSLKRELKYYILNVYIPSMMMVIISWTSFWMHETKIVGRVLATLAPLLVLAMTVYNFNSNLAIVSYTKAIDVWTGICLTFVFMALLEGYTVNYLSRWEKKDKVGKDAQAQVEVGPNSTDGLPEEIKPKLINKEMFVFPGTLSGGIDVVAKVGFPLAFVLFNIIYWSIY